MTVLVLTLAANYSKWWLQAQAEPGHDRIQVDDLAGTVNIDLSAHQCRLTSFYQCRQLPHVVEGRLDAHFSQTPCLPC
jgi:hypothetical protein